MLQIGIREPGSAITHFIAMMMAIFATSPLLVKAALNGIIQRFWQWPCLWEAWCCFMCKYGVPFACCPG